MESTKIEKIGFFSKCWTTIKSVSWNFIKSLFGTWGSAARTVALTGLMVSAEILIPGVIPLLLCAGVVGLGVAYYVGHMDIALKATKKGIPVEVASAEVMGGDFVIIPNPAATK